MSMTTSPANDCPTLQVWKWSGKGYVPMAVSDIPVWSAIRNVTWSPDSQGFMLSGWVSPVCILFRLESGTYDCEKFGRKDFHVNFYPGGSL